MAKFVTRLTVILVSLYFLVAHFFAYYFGIDILYNSYILLFELCVVCYTFMHGAYHCKYMRWTAASIFVCDSTNHADYYLNLFTATELFYVSLVLLLLGLSATTFSALRHFYKVKQLKAIRNKLWKQQTEN